MDSKKGSKRKIDDIIGLNNSEDATEPQPKKQKLNLTSNDEEKSPKIIQNDEKLSNDMVEQVELPPEILVSIFCQLSRQDLAMAGAVCQHWWLVSKDESLSWYPIKQFPVVEDSYAYTMSTNPKNDSRKSLYPNAGPPVKMKSFEFINGAYFAMFVDAKGNSAAIARIENYSHIGLDDTVLQGLKNTDCYRLVLDSIEDKSSKLIYTVSIEANLAKLEQQIRSGETPALIKYFKHAAIQNLINNYGANRNIDHYFKPKEAYLPTVLPLIAEQPPSLTGVKLHNYQINAINWMVTTEQEADKKVNVSPLLKTNVSNILLKLTIDEEKLVLFENASEHNLEFKPKGGVLADEMGLGKTIEMLGLMLSNPMKEEPKKSGSYFTTKATLVLCPNHLVDQWVKEVQKHSEPKMTVIPITTIAQVKKLTYQQIIDADVVVVTYNLLKNKNYLAYPNHGTQIKMDAAAPHDRIDRVDKMLDDLKTKAPEKIKGVILDHFHWHRIVMDEGHEVIGDDFTTDVIFYLQRTFSWYMSGTPFPNTNALEGVRTFLDMFIKRTISINTRDRTPEERTYTTENWAGHHKRPWTEVYIESTLNEYLLDNLVWRNTKESVNEEYQMVATKPEVVLLDFTPIEAAIYEDLVFSQKLRHQGQQPFTYQFNRRGKDAVRELCCKLNYDWGNTLEEMREFMIKQKLQDIETQKQRITSHKAAKITHQNELNAPRNVYNTWAKQTATRFLADYEKNLEALEKTLEELHRLLKAFQDIKPRDTSKIKYNTKDYWLENYGTKMASLVGYLQDLFAKEPTTRVIIFSQFTDYLDMIAALLEENDINSSTVEGNVYKKSKALKKFKDDNSEVQVILLSLSKAASGTNLIEASHVLLMDPMTGTKEEAQAYENQAIGRAQRQGQTKPVTVVRFVIKNTIEHEYYVRNTGTKQHGHVMLNRSNSKLVRSGSFGTLIANK